MIKREIYMSRIRPFIGNAPDKKDMADLGYFAVVENLSC